MADWRRVEQGPQGEIRASVLRIRPLRWKWMTSAEGEKLRFGNAFTRRGAKRKAEGALVQHMAKIVPAE